MDWISIIIGLGAGGGAIWYVMRKKIKALIEIVEDLVYLKEEIEDVVIKYEKAVKDGVISLDEVNIIIREIEDVLEAMNRVIEDYEELVGGEGK